MRAARWKRLYGMMLVFIVVMGILPPLAFANTTTYPVFKMDSAASAIIRHVHPNFEKHATNSVSQGGLSQQLAGSASDHVNVLYQQVLQWRDTVKPQLKQVSEEITQYDSTFQNVYATILKDVSAQNKQQLLTSLKQIQTAFTRQKEQVSSLANTLTSFRNELTSHSQVLMEDLNKIKAEKEGYRSPREAELKETFKDNPERLRTALLQLDGDTSRLFGTLETKLKYVTDTDAAGGLATFIEDMKTNWSSLDAKLKNVIQQVETTTGSIDSAFLQSELKTVETAWKGIIEKADRLGNEYKYSKQTVPNMEPWVIIPDWV